MLNWSRTKKPVCIENKIINDKFKCVKLNILDLVERKFVSKHGKMININIVNSDLYHIHYLFVSRCNSTFILIKSKKSRTIMIIQFSENIRSTLSYSYHFTLFFTTLNKAIL